MDEAHSNKKRQLFDSSELLLTIGLTEAVNKTNSTMILTLPHSVHCSDTESGCLITKDLPSAPADYEATAAHYAEQLKQSGCKTSLTVLPLRELTVAYMPYEAKRRLCHAYDYFLADVRILHRLGNKLGAQFANKNRRKIPLPVDLEARDLSAEIDKALRCVRICLIGTTVSCLVGPINTQLSESDKDRLDEDQRLLANIASACEQLANRLANLGSDGPIIASLYLRHPCSGNVPVFVRTAAAVETTKTNNSDPIVSETGKDLAKTKTKKTARDLDKDLAELGATLWDQELLAKTVKKKQSKAKTVTAKQGKPQSKKRKQFGNIQQKQQKEPKKTKKGKPSPQKQKKNKQKQQKSKA